MPSDSANLTPAREAIMDAVRVSGRLRIAPLVEWMIAAAFLLADRAPSPRSSCASCAVRTGIPAESPRHVRSSPRCPPRCRHARCRCRCCRSSTARRFASGNRGDGCGQPGRAAESGRQEVERGTLGERLTRFYEYAGSKFIVVFEPFERGGEPRVAAIYLP
jgi:hypothetical protein